MPSGLIHISTLRFSSLPASDSVDQTYIEHSIRCSQNKNHLENLKTLTSLRYGGQGIPRHESAHGSNCGSSDELGDDSCDFSAFRSGLSPIRSSWLQRIVELRNIFFCVRPLTLQSVHGLGNRIGITGMR